MVAGKLPFGCPGNEFAALVLLLVSAATVVVDPCCPPPPPGVGDGWFPGGWLCELEPQPISVTQVNSAIRRATSEMRRWQSTFSLFGKMI